MNIFLIRPIFGPPPSPANDVENLYQKLKQHGFARIDKWTLDESASEIENGKLVFG
jgi:D-hexose-6-phosphate mutarotase